MLSGPETSGWKSRGPGDDLVVVSQKVSYVALLCFKRKHLRENSWIYFWLEMNSFVLPLESPLANPFFRHTEITENESSFLLVSPINSSFVSIMCFHILSPFYLSYLSSLDRHGGEGIFQQRDFQTLESDKNAHFWVPPSELLILKWVPEINIWNKSLAILQDTLENIALTFH